MKLSRFVWTAVLLAGCGSTPPPKELVDARESYDKIKAGQASQLRPDQVHQAKLALDQAEAAFTDDPGADKTRDLAYIALRKSELAEAEGGLAAAQSSKDQASKDLNQVSQQTVAELSKTRAQLDTETKARKEAERRAKEAMDKLANAAASVKQEDRGTVITLPGNVLFASARWALLPEAMNRLNAVADALKNQEDHKMVVEGHTDSQGNEGSNIELGSKRAQAVRDYLVSRGIPSEKISSVGIGQARPVASNSTADGRAQNRRVEIIVQPLEKR